jgi:VWFA-related protein
MKTPKGIALAIAALILNGGALLGEQQTSPGQAPVFRTGVELVTVDVGVVDRRGLPLRGLGPADFVVNVNGHPRRVITAEFMDVAGERASAARTPELMPISTNLGATVGRLYVFIVDQGTLEPGQVRHVAKAASRFFSGLSFADRSALLLMPSGPNVEFTWAHDRVSDALQRVSGLASSSNEMEFASLTEARDIANRNTIALRNIGLRECGGISAGGFDPGGPVTGNPTPPSPGAVPPPGGAAPPGGETGGSGTAAGGTRPPGGSGAGGGSRAPRGGSGLGMEACARQVQMRAEWVWRNAHSTSVSSLMQLRQTLAGLGRIQGDKTVILISGGWPLEDGERSSWLSTVAAEAAAARATLFTMFLPTNSNSASRRTISSTPVDDQWLYSWPLETLASMSGGESFRVDVAAEAAFERLGLELAGYYRIGVEKSAADADGKPRRMTVEVSRSGATVRAREMFDVRTFEDQNAAARLASALDAPIVATGIGLRVTSYLAADPHDVARLKLVLTGEASRVDAGEATVQLVVHDMEGKKILTGEQPIGEPTGDGLAFSTNIPLAPGKYMVRVAVMDGTGRVGSVDHRADVHQVPLGPMFATGPLLVRVQREAGVQPRIAVNAVRQDERLALQMDLEGERSQLASTEVTFEIAATAEGPSLVSAEAQLSRDDRGSFMLAQAVTDVRVLPPGTYVVRARVKSGGAPLGEVRRGFNVTEAPLSTPGDAAVVPTDATRRLTAGRAPTRGIISVPRFALDQALAPPVLGTFLDRVAARPDAASPMIRELVDRARSSGVEQVTVSDTLAAEYPVAAFLRGLSLLSQNKIEHAANAFRSAMRASSNFYPAMVYLGVCYAAGGNDKEATGAWRTALIRESDALPLHLLLADALLRQERADMALQILNAARSRWPDDDGLKRRFVLAALLAGEHVDGLRILDELVEKHAEDEPTLTAALLMLYKAFEEGRPIQDAEQDRARMIRLADAYRARGGPSLALIETWMTEVTRKR